MANTEFYLVRHGETFAKTNNNPLGEPFVCGSGNKLSRETSLTEKGIMQMRNLGECLKDVGFSLIIHSDLLRSKQSAEEIVKGIGDKDLKIFEAKEVSEIDYGHDEGVSVREVKKRKEDFFRDMTKTGEDYAKFVGAESFAEAKKRMSNFLNKIAEEKANQKILVVTHSGAMRAYSGNIVPGKDIGFGEIIKIRINNGVSEFL